MTPQEVDALTVQMLEATSSPEARRRARLDTINDIPAYDTVPDLTPLERRRQRRRAMREDAA